MIKSNPVRDSEGKVVKANKIYVSTKYSSDGKNTDGFWIDYDPNDRYALFLLDFALERSPGVEYYTIYDENGRIAKLPSRN